MSGNDLQTKWTKIKVRKILGPTLAVLGLLYTYRSHLDACPPEVIFFAWSILPPMWLIFEYWFFYDKTETTLDNFDAFKHSQALARNLWLGFLIFLAVFYLLEWNK